MVFIDYNILTLAIVSKLFFREISAARHNIVKHKWQYCISLKRFCMLVILKNLVPFHIGSSTFCLCFQKTYVVRATCVSAYLVILTSPYGLFKRFTLKEEILLTFTTMLNTIYVQASWLRPKNQHHIYPNTRHPQIRCTQRLPQATVHHITCHKKSV